jgi:hypothetical protein
MSGPLCFQFAIFGGGSFQVFAQGARGILPFPRSGNYTLLLMYQHLVQNCNHHLICQIFQLHAHVRFTHHYESCDLLMWPGSHHDCYGKLAPHDTGTWSQDKLDYVPTMLLQSPDGALLRYNFLVRIMAAKDACAPRVFIQDEITESIAKYVSAADMFRLSTTCKRLRGILC